jgi:hypothetical protein
VAFGLAAFTRPDLESRSEAKLYLGSARALITPGQAMDRRLEPGYPAFLGALLAVGLDPAVWTPAAQTAVFGASLWLFLHAVAGGSVRPATTAAVAAAVSCVPTFLITVNGAVFTESISASAVLLLLASLVLLWRSAASAPGGLRALGWLAGAVATSVYLGLTKGSFSFVALAFLPLLVVSLRLLGRVRVRERPAFFAAAALVCVAPHVAVKLWLHPAGTERFVRGGQIVYGRSVYVSRFDFRRDSVPFLVAALSDAACIRLWGERCASYRFDAENRLGEALTLQGESDDELWRRGWRIAREHPVRALAFVPFELARLVVHHTTRGFAALEVPVLGELSRSNAVIALLKLLNLLVYAVPVACGVVLHRRGGGVRSAWWGLPGHARVGVLLAGAYCLAYLAVHGMATAILRMVYPIAVLPLLFAVGAAAVTGARLRRGTARSAGLPTATRADARSVTSRGQP